MAGENILVVDDDDALRLVLVGLLKQAGYQARAVPSAEQALVEVGKSPIDLVVTDVRMPGMDGIALLGALTKSVPDLPVIVLSAHGTVPMAVEAMKQGAKEFMLKPFDREEVITTIDRTLRAAAARASAPPPVPTASRLIGDSPRMHELREMIARAARSNATVMLRGESGSGKEVAAREIHEQSARKGGPFVAVHCAALPETLLESELFGYEKGAFTGAQKRKPGRVELAEGGTLFLDEIGDVSLPVQVKLLRLLACWDTAWARPPRSEAGERSAGRPCPASSARPAWPLSTPGSPPRRSASWRRSPRSSPRCFRSVSRSPAASTPPRACWPAG